MPVNKVDERPFRLNWLDSNFFLAAAIAGSVRSVGGGGGGGGGEGAPPKPGNMLIFLYPCIVDKGLLQNYLNLKLP